MKVAQKFRRIVSLAAAIASVPPFALAVGAQQLGVSAPKMGPAFVAPVPHIQAATPSCNRSAARVIGQLATGLLGAWVGGLGAYAAVYGLDPSETRVDGDAGYKPNANTAFAIGSWIGSTAMIFVAGRPRCGSLGPTAVGTGIPSAVLILGRDMGYLAILGALFVAPVQALGGTLMFPKR